MRGYDRMSPEQSRNDITTTVPRPRCYVSRSATATSQRRAVEGRVEAARGALEAADPVGGARELTSRGRARRAWGGIPAVSIV